VLFWQFYFLLIVIITLIPHVSPLTPITSVMPLIFVLLVSAVKEGYEDYVSLVSSRKKKQIRTRKRKKTNKKNSFSFFLQRRYRSDKEVNNRVFKKLMPDGSKVDVLSKDIKVGDLLYMTKDQLTPADSILLASALPDGVCYIETSQLDGYTLLPLFPPTFTTAIKKKELFHQFRFHQFFQLEAKNSLFFFRFLVLERAT
jgi:phospholipid-transporting ATPase